MPARRWNLADFDIVLGNPALSAEELSRLLPHRRAAEINRLRDTVHAWHVPPYGAGIIPTDAMARHLLRRRGTLLCAACGSQF